MYSAKDRYTLIEQSSNYRITCMQYSQKNFMRIIGNEQKNNGQNFWEILERIIGKILSIIGAGLSIKRYSIGHGNALQLSIMLFCASLPAVRLGSARCRPSDFSQVMYSCVRFTNFSIRPLNHLASF